MATKLETLSEADNGRGCLGRCEDDEPVFVLCARDMTASGKVRQWADDVERIAERSGELTEGRKAKIAEARDVAAAMDAWRVRRFGKLPD